MLSKRKFRWILVHIDSKEFKYSKVSENSLQNINNNDNNENDSITTTDIFKSIRESIVSYFGVYGLSTTEELHGVC